MSTASFNGLLIISVIAVMAPVVAASAKRVKLPGVVVEITAGGIVGPSVLAWVKIDQPVSVVALPGLAFLLFLAGLEIDLRATGLAAVGVQVREADYSRPETLGAALAGVDRLLLVSSSEVGQLVARGDLETSSADLAHLLGRPATPLAEVVRAGYDLLKVRSKTAVIGLIGAGRIGGTVARLAADAGYHVVLSNSREPGTLSDLTSRLGPHARAVTAAAAAAGRARRELVATGETARKRTVETSGELTGQEVQVARLARDGQARLAVLSACETATIGEELVDEVVNFPTGMLQAGAAACIGSLWSVSDVSTALLMRRFYELWRAGIGPSEALRRAQRWLRDTSNEELLEAGYASAPQSGDRAPQVQAFWRKARPYYHPYYWAAFTFYGA